MLQGNALCVTCEETYFKMTADEWVEVAELQSTQEEADIRLFLHALHAARTGSKAVIVTAEDTDVLLLCLAFPKGLQFTCCIYVATSSTNEVNDMCYQLFCAKRGEIEFSLLPPCRDCLLMHLHRANYQAAIWKYWMHARPTVPDPTKCGWIDDDGKLAIHWMLICGNQKPKQEDSF